MAPFKIGDRVAYSAKFCRSIGAFTGDVPHMRGTVTKITPLGENHVIYFNEDDGRSGSALASNLAHVGPNMRFANCD